MDIKDLNEDELKYAKEIKVLKQLRKVNAPLNFESELMRKIQAPEKVERESFWSSILTPRKFAPSAALALTTILILFIINLDSENSENPLLAEPKVREDIVEARSLSPEEQLDLSFKEANPLNEKKTTPVKPEKQQLNDEDNFAGNSDTVGLSEKSFKSRTSSPGVSSEAGAVFSSDGISKSGLNFRQIRLNDEERAELYKLKQHVKSIMESRGNHQ